MSSLKNSTHYRHKTHTWPEPAHGERRKNNCEDPIYFLKMEKYKNSILIYFILVQQEWHGMEQRELSQEQRQR